jgi:hypothetical protein
MVATTLNGAHGLASNAPTATTEIEQQALTFLKSLPREWSRSSSRDCKTYEDKNIDALAVTFATSAANFLLAFTRQYGAITITSEHRTQQEQVCVCIGENGPCAGKPHVIKGKMALGSSFMHLGISSALHSTSARAWSVGGCGLHSFAQLNPQFGVHFPLGQRDPTWNRVTRSRSKIASLRRLVAGFAVKPAHGLTLFGGPRHRYF